MGMARGSSFCAPYFSEVPEGTVVLYANEKLSIITQIPRSLVSSASEKNFCGLIQWNVFGGEFPLRRLREYCSVGVHQLRSAKSMMV